MYLIVGVSIIIIIAVFLYIMFKKRLKVVAFKNEQSESDWKDIIDKGENDTIEFKSSLIAYETVTGAAEGLPLLAPMSQVAGRMSIQAGAASLEAARGGAGLLLGGVPGVAPAKVVVLGGGVVGANAVQMALGLGA